MDQVIQLVGAVLILTAFVRSQQGHMATDSTRYLALNTAGAAILAIVALVHGDLGFLLLEGTWTFVSATGLLREISHR